MSQEYEESRFRTRTSNKNTKTAPSGKPNPTEIVLSQRDRGPSSISAAILESQLQQERSERRIERFFWIFCVSIFLELLIYKYLDSNLAFIIVSCFIVTGLTGLANWLEVPWVVRPLEALFARLSGTMKASREPEPPPTKRGDP